MSNLFAWKMNAIIAELKYSVSNIRLKYDVELQDDSSYICGIPKPFGAGAGGVMKIDGNYAGLQCTSMALAAIIKNMVRPKFTPKRINKILAVGNDLHTHLRDNVKLSEHPDGKVAIEDFPHAYFLNVGKIFGKEAKVKLTEHWQNVFTSKLGGFEDFLTLKEYLESWQFKMAKRTGFLVSVRDFSYAIIRYRSGKYALFDPHGHLKFNGEFVKEKAATVKFPSIESLEQFIIDMYGVGQQVVVAPVSVLFKSGGVVSKLGAAQKPKPQKEEYTPFFLPTHTTIEVEAKSYTSDDVTTKDAQASADNLNAAEEVSPFVGLMGWRM